MISIHDVVNKIADSDLVLVGLGEEFDEIRYLNQNEKYLQIKNKILDDDKNTWLLPFIQSYFLKDHQELISAYKNLETILEEKNYFLISTNMNSVLNKFNFHKGRVVKPCGGFDYLQCVSDKCDYLSELGDDFLVKFQKKIIDNMDFSVLNDMSCPKCKCNLAFNNIYVENYNENGYLSQWNTYKKWLQGTLNKKLCVLELGVSFSMPSVIRFPFEKIVFFNQKSTMIRVNEKLYQLSSEIGERSFSVPQNAVDFLNEL